MKKSIKLKDMQKIEIDMLSEIKKICKKLKINYYLCGGTLLGAVRHKGFIPWDDDIDVCMLREDYEKFEQFFIDNDGLLGNYRLLSLKLENDYYYPMMKLVDTRTYMKELDTSDIKNMGVYLDIFPIDGCPNNLLLRKIFFKRMSLLYKSLYMSYYDFFETGTKLLKPIKFIWFKLSKIIGSRKIANHIEKVAKKYNPKKYDLVGTVTSGTTRDIMDSKIYQKTALYDFEGVKHMGVKDYDTYLTSMYGDYMTLPPKEKQVTHHKYIAHYK